MSSRKRFFVLEVLESRDLLAGDVAVSINAGSMRVTGDALANEIAITDLGGGKISVAGLNGTTVNTQSGTQTFNGVNGHLKVDLKDGADKVAFVGIAGHELREIDIRTGAGDDAVTVDKVFGQLEIDTGVDHDTVIIADASARCIEVETRTGDDSVTVDKISARELEIDSGAGNDSVVVAAVTASSVEVETGAGDDVVIVGSTSSTRHDVLIKAREVEIETGEGKDSIKLVDAVIEAAETEIETGAGDDTIEINDVQATGSFKVATGQGKEVVSITKSTFAILGVKLGAGDADSLVITDTKSTRTKLDGGAGLGDSLKVVTSDLGTLQKIGFEIII